MMKSAGAVIRVSTSKQLDGTSPDKQLENILALADRQGYSVNPKHIWQNAESGGLKGEQREGFQKSLRAAESGEISRVFVFSLDRLGRDLIETLVYLRALTDRGADCWEAEHGQHLKHDDLVVMILGAVASNERKQILARTQDGLRRSVAAGKYSGGIVAYGYRVNPDTKILEINEPEAEVVRSIFRWATEEQTSCPKIADRLNALNIPTHYSKDERLVTRKGKFSPEHTMQVWRSGQVYRILRNKAYTGHWTYGKRSKKMNSQRTEGYSPAIVSEETFKKAQEIIASHNFQNRRNTKHEYLLRGLIRCGLCKKTFCGDTTSSISHPKKSHYYSCGGRRNWRRMGIQQKCDNVYVRGNHLEEFVWNDIKMFCQHPEFAIAQLRENSQPYENDLDDRIKKAENLLAELKRQELNTLQIATQSKEVDIDTLDTITAEIKRRKETLLEHIAKLNTARQLSLFREDEIQNALLRLKEIAGIIENATFEEKRKAVLSIVKSIEIVPEEVNGKRVPHVTIVYRFNEPSPEIPELPQDYFGLNGLIGITNHTPRSTTARQYADRSSASKAPKAK